MWIPTRPLDDKSPIGRGAVARTGAWKRVGGFAGGVVLALAGLLLAVASAVAYGLRAVDGQMGGESAMAFGLRGAGGLCLVVAGFAVMVLCTRGIEALDAPATDHRQDLAGSLSGEDILCARCGAANDHLARYCDQCGRRL